MHEEAIYHFNKTRKQRSRTYISMGTFSLVYIAAMLTFEHLEGVSIPEPMRTICLWSFSVSSVLLFSIAYWHRRNPASFEAKVTNERLIVSYPNSEQWSFDVALNDIKRFENRETLSHAGTGIGKQGVLLKNGTFHHISMNYDLNLNTLHKEVQKIRPDIPFPKRVNRKVEGFLAKDFDE